MHSIFLPRNSSIPFCFLQRPQFPFKLGNQLIARLKPVNSLGLAYLFSSLIAATPVQQCWISDRIGSVEAALFLLVAVAAIYWGMSKISKGGKYGPLEYHISSRLWGCRKRGALYPSALYALYSKYRSNLCYSNQNSAVPNLFIRR